MITTLLNNKYTVPTLLLMLPVEKKTLFGSVRGMFQTELQFWFICPITKKPVKSGPKGKGYRIQVNLSSFVDFLISFLLERCGLLLDAIDIFVIVIMNLFCLSHYLTTFDYLSVRHSFLWYSILDVRLFVSNRGFHVYFLIIILMIKVTQKWVKQAAPLLIFTLSVVKVLLQVYGIPLPAIPAGLYGDDCIGISIAL
jgi:hypothetical protein